MRNTRRLATCTSVLVGGLLLAVPASAQEVDCAQYPADCPIGGGGEAPVQGDDSTDDSTGDSTDAGSGSTDAGSGSTDAGGGSTDAGNDTTDNAVNDAASLPVTGGEVTLIALAGVAALGGGVALTVAGRKRATV